MTIFDWVKASIWESTRIAHVAWRTMIGCIALGSSHERKKKVDGGRWGGG